MTITIAKERNAAAEATLEWEKPGVLYARVYENWGGEWHQTHESRPYPVSAENNARAAYRRFAKRYVK